MTLLGKVYFGVSLTLLMVGVLWASSTLQANTGTVRIRVATPQADLVEPLATPEYVVNRAALMVGWGLAGSLVIVWAIRAPFRIRGLARSRRRIKDLEREVLELRKLPLRQQEDDEWLAAEAQLEDGTRKVMTEQIARDGRDERRSRDKPTRRGGL